MILSSLELSWGFEVSTWAVLRSIVWLVETVLLCTSFELQYCGSVGPVLNRTGTLATEVAEKAEILNTFVLVFTAKASP